VENSYSDSIKTFHIIDENKCLKCKTYDCENACFRGIYKIIQKDTAPKCVAIQERESYCLKCHICTTACKYNAIEIL